MCIIKSLAKSIVVVVASASLPLLASAEPITVELGSSGPGYSSPAIAEIDGNLNNGKEIAVASANGIVSVVLGDGTILWEKALPTNSCTSLSGNNRAHSSPAVGALLGGTNQYVVVGYGGIAGTACGGGVVAFNGPDGTEAWRFDLKQFAKRRRLFAISHSVFSSPTLFDIDQDGTLEVVFGSLDRNIYMLSASGRLKGFYHAADTVFSSAAVADTNGDASPEIIIGTDISKNTVINPPTPNGGYLYALKSSLFKRGVEIGFRKAGSAVWRAEFNQVVQSPPVVAELISANTGKEVVVATGCYFPENTTNKLGRDVKVFSLATGRLLRTLQVPACTGAEPAVADVDGDGLNDVVIPVQGLSVYGGDGTSRVIAWNPDSNTTLWTTVPLVNDHNSSTVGLFGGLVIADLDKNGSREVVVANGSGLTILSGATGEHLSCEAASCDDGRSSFTGFKGLKNAVAVADLTGDGTLELVVAGSLNRVGTLKIYTELATLITSSAGNNPNYTPWPMFRGGPLHTGVQVE